MAVDLHRPPHIITKIQVQPTDADMDGTLRRINQKGCISSPTY
jgi:hypothetical protein